MTGGPRGGSGAAVRAAGLETSGISDLCGRDDAHLQQLWVDWPRAASIFRELEVMVPADRLGHIGATWVKRHPTWRAAAQFAGGVEGWLDLFRATAAEVCPPAGAALVVDRAERIARSLHMAVEDGRRR